MRTAFVLSALAVVVPALAAPTVVPITKRAGSVKPDSYIIKFKDGPSKDAVVGAITEALTQDGSSVTYDYHPLFKGIAVTLLGSDLSLVQRISDVEWIEQDSITSLSYEQGLDGLSPVGERRGSAESLPLAKRGDLGENVDVYGIDTGIYTEHECFGGRAFWGKTFGGYADADGHGHGTHTAGTAVGKEYGLATAARIFAVKVLGDNGSGSLSDVMQGVVWSYNNTKEAQKPSIATMSLGGPAINSRALDEAITNAIGGGLHFTIAAGNDNVDAQLYSPAHVEMANTIGAANSSAENEKATFSNFGKLIDVWAPGVNIKSAWIGSPNAVNTISGTSMATPYVAGILAVALSKYGQMDPRALSDKLKEKADPVVKFTDPKNAPAVLAGSNNLLANSW